MKLIVAFLISLAVLPARQAPQGGRPGRPRVGLALAGGSALGLSHIGVLQWLEENRIPVDFIAGTSMGGLVAGLHASGMTASELVEFVEGIDWQLALSSSTPYNDLSFRRKEDAAQYPTAFELGLKNIRLNLPSGLSPGEGVSLVLSRFTAPYGDMRSFEDLPTPFRCVASDLVSGKGVVFERGSLFDALRATMSLPALFAPVRKDGMVLVDGGLTNNLPVDVVRAMGADIVVAVALDVPTNEKDFQSLLGIASRSISYMIMANERPNIAAADIVLMPSLKGMTGADYGKYREFRKLGYDAAIVKAEQLQKLQVDAKAYAAHSAARQARRRSTSIRPTRVLVEGDVAPKLEKAVVSSLTPAPGATLDRAVLEEQMEKLTGVGRFETATYEFRRTDGQETLVVRVREKTYGPPLLRPSVFLDGENGEGFRFGAAARLTFLDIGGPASEWRTDLSVGTFNRLESEYYHRLRGGKWFLAPRAGLIQELIPVYGRDSVRLADFTEKNYFGALDMGYAFGRRQELRLGYTGGYLKTKLNTGMIDPAPLSGRYGFAHLMLRHDSRDDPVIPERGTAAMVRISWFNRYPLVSGAFGALEGSWSHSRKFGKSYTVLSQIQVAGTALESGYPALYRLGGLSNMSALGRHQMIGNRLYYGHAYLLRSITRNLAPAGRLYALFGYETGRAWFRGETAKPRHNGLFGVTAATPLGAVFFGGAIGDQGDRKVLFRLGRLF